MSSSNQLDRWLRAVVDTPGLTALSYADATRVLLEDSLRAAEIVRANEGPVIDVGSGNGAPGLPLAQALSEREFTLLEAERRKCDFLEQHAPPNARIVWGRAEEQETDWAGVALAKALAPPPVAAEWCLPLVRTGGIAIVWVGESAERDPVEKVAALLAAELERAADGLFVLRKLAPTPEGFPRRTGVAKKRPLA